MQSRLTVKAPEGTEISVLDGNFEIVKRGYGGLQAVLEEGIYKIQAQVGSSRLEELVVLREDKDLNFVVPIVTAAPLQSTNPESFPFQEAARRSSLKIDQHLGSGASLFVFVRWDRWRDSSNESPAAGLALQGLDGEELLGFEQLADESLNWMGTRIDVNPGAYVIGSNRRDGLRQGVIACKGWTTQVFIRCKRHNAGALIDADNTTVLMRSLRSHDISLAPGFEPGDFQAHRVETLRLGLKYGRQNLSPGAMVELLEGKVNDPMWGLLGGYVLLQSNFRKDRLRNLVNRLRELLGQEHPDVEGLALAAGMGDDQFVLRYPPMLRQSWQAILVATLDRPEIIPAESMPELHADLFLPREPWLLWENRDTASTASRDLPEGILRNFANYVEFREREEEKAHHSASQVTVLLRKLWNWITPAHNVDLNSGTQMPEEENVTSIPPNLLDLLSYEERRQLVLALGLPMRQLQQLIANYNKQPNPSNP